MFRHPLKPFALGLAMAAALLAGCEKGKTEPKDAKTAGAGKGETPKPDTGSDFEVEEAVPIALFDGALVAQYLERSVDPVAGGYATLPARTSEAQFVTAATASDTVDYSFSAATIALSDRAESQLAANAGAVRELLDQLFGPTGVFRGTPLRIKRQAEKVRAVYVMPGTPSRYVVIDYLATRPFPYVAEIYEAGAAPAGATPDGRFLATIVEASGAAGTRRAKIRSYARPADATLAAFVLLELDEGTKKFSTTLRYEMPSDARPASTTLLIADDPAGAERLVQGALLWELPAAVVPADAILPPRHYAPQNGDVELFQQLRPNTRVGNAAQAALFLRAEDREAAGASARDYERIMLDHLTEVVRHEGVNQGCGTTGEAIRDAFEKAGKAPTTRLAQLPSDVCRTNAETTDEAVAAAVKETCEAKIDLALDVVFATVGKRTYHLCVKHQEAQLLRNPIDTVIGDGGGRKIATELAPFAALNERLAATPWIDLGALIAVQTQSFERKALSDSDRDTAIPPP